MQKKTSKKRTRPYTGTIYGKAKVRSYYVLKQSIRHKGENIERRASSSRIEGMDLATDVMTPIAIDFGP